MALKIEPIVDRCVHEEESLRRLGRFEALQFSLSPSDRLVGVFRAIVGSQTLLMAAGKAEIAKRRSIRPEPVGYNRPGRKTLPFHQFSQQSQRGGFVTAALNQHVQHLAFAVDRAPQKHMSASDPNNHFVEVPAIIRLGAPADETRGDLGPEFQHPATDAFITDINAALRQQLLDIAITQREAVIEPDSVSDNVRRKLMAGVRNRLHRPLSQTVRSRDNAEAETVRSIFRRYVSLGSVHLLQRELAAQDVRSKRRVTKTDKQLGGAIIDRGALYHMLSNPVYRGCIQHREKLYEGAHPAIVDDELWTTVQDKLAENTREKPSTPKLSTPPILQGRLVDDRGHAMAVVHTKKRITRYRYYASVALNPSKSGEPGSVPRIAVGVLDGFVVRQLAPRLSRGWLPDCSDDERIRAAIAQLVLSDDRITITLGADALQADLTIPSGPVRKAGDQVEITIETRLKHRKGAMHIECAVGAAGTGQVDKALVRAVCLTRAWAHGLARGEYKTITEVAERFGYWDHHVANLMPLAWLAPDLVEDVLDGRQPPGLTLSMLIKRQLPMDWEAQRALFRNSRLR
jgi:site-specific DNA recombinase